MTDIGVPGITGAELIGQGAFGRVYRARQEDLSRDVAVKVISNVDLDDTNRGRFGREARAIGRLSGHPNIVDVYAQGETADGKPYLIMEFCAGGSLADRTDGGAPLPWPVATEVVIEIAGALQTAHAKGILHRDIKPANILLDDYDTPKLGDFGIAYLRNEEKLTATGLLTGSPAHIAPELVAGEQPTPVSDVYSLASTLFALITGEAPFVRTSDTSILSLLRRISFEPAPYLGQWNVPPAIADIVAASLHKDVSMRPPTCHDFAQALRQARVGLGLPPGDYEVARTQTSSPSPPVVAQQQSLVAPPPPQVAQQQPSQHPPQQPPKQGLWASAPDGAKIALIVLAAAIIVVYVLLVVLLRDDGRSAANLVAGSLGGITWPAT